MNKIYNIKQNTIGVYKITNLINGKIYIGSSVNISGRLSNHFNRDSRRYIKHPFYLDIRKYGRKNFSYNILEECKKEDLIKREQYYFDLLKPEYNLIRPEECNFNNPIVSKKAHINSNDWIHVQKRKLLYNTELYKSRFKEIQRKRFKKVTMYKDNFEMTFENMSECARWLNKYTVYKGKNKVSKIKAVCDGERHTAYGYKFKYFKV